MINLFDVCDKKLTHIYILIIININNAHYDKKLSLMR